jgi:hypothetical protein
MIGLFSFILVGAYYYQERAMQVSTSEKLCEETRKEIDDIVRDPNYSYERKRAKIQQAIADAEKTLVANNYFCPFTIPEAQMEP